MKKYNSPPYKLILVGQRFGMLTVIKELDKRFSVVNSNKITKKARIEATILNNLTPISKSEICSILPDVSATTVEVVLASMVKDGTIIKIGNGRNTKYIKNNV